MTSASAPRRTPRVLTLVVLFLSADGGPQNGGTEITTVPPQSRDVATYRAADIAGHDRDLGDSIDVSAQLGLGLRQGNR